MVKPLFREYDSFQLAKALPSDSVSPGTKGVVLMVFGGEPPAYEVEFPDGQGRNLGNLATYTITEEYMTATKGGD
jgi:hypothetical protein